jgi:putative ABC transport system substrate-binding protein
MTGTRIQGASVSHPKSRLNVAVDQCTKSSAACARQLVVAEIATENDIELAFKMLTRQRIGALLMGPDPFFDPREHIIELAARHRLPAVYSSHEFQPNGGLASYGSSITDTLRTV